MNGLRSATLRLDPACPVRAHRPARAQVAAEGMDNMHRPRLQALGVYSVVRPLGHSAGPAGRRRREPETKELCTVLVAPAPGGRENACVPGRSIFRATGY